MDILILIYIQQPYYPTEQKVNNSCVRKSTHSKQNLLPAGLPFIDWNNRDIEDLDNLTLYLEWNID